MQSPLLLPMLSPGAGAREGGTSPLTFPAGPTHLLCAICSRWHNLWPGLKLPKMPVGSQWAIGPTLYFLLQGLWPLNSGDWNAGSRSPRYITCSRASKTARGRQLEEAPWPGTGQPGQSQWGGISPHLVPCLMLGRVALGVLSSAFLVLSVLPGPKTPVPGREAAVELEIWRLLGLKVIWHLQLAKFWS